MTCCRSGSSSDSTHHGLAHTHKKNFFCLFTSMYVVMHAHRPTLLHVYHMQLQGRQMCCVQHLAMSRICMQNSAHMHAQNHSRHMSWYFGGTALDKRTDHGTADTRGQAQMSTDANYAAAPTTIFAGHSCVKTIHTYMQTSADECACQPGHVPAWPLAGGLVETNITISEASTSHETGTVVYEEPFRRSPANPDDRFSVVSAVTPTGHATATADIKWHSWFEWVDAHHTQRRTWNYTVNTTTVHRTLTSLNITTLEWVYTQGAMHVVVCTHVALCVSVCVCVSVCLCLCVLSWVACACLHTKIEMSRQNSFDVRECWCAYLSNHPLGCERKQDAAYLHDHTRTK